MTTAGGCGTTKRAIHTCPHLPKLMHTWLMRSDSRRRLTASGMDLLAIAAARSSSTSSGFRQSLQAGWHQVKGGKKAAFRHPCMIAGNGGTKGKAAAHKQALWGGKTKGKKEG